MKSFYRPSFIVWCLLKLMSFPERMRRQLNGKPRFWLVSLFLFGGVILHLTGSNPYLARETNGWSDGPFWRSWFFLSAAVLLIRAIAINIFGERESEILVRSF